MTGEESALVDSTAIELDPWYSTDGRFLYYSSSVGGDFDLWKLDLSNGEKNRFTDSAGVERRPMPRRDGKMGVYLDKKRGGRDRIVELDMSSGDERDILTQSIASQTHPGLSPDGRSIVVNWPPPLGYDLLLIDLEGGDPIRLNSGSRLPLAPAFSADGKGVYFSEANDEQEF